MSDVKPIAPPEAAASPDHPDHARWVKDKTLAMEVAHANATGGTHRDAELANQRNLERLAGKARDLPIRSRSASTQERDEPNLGNAGRWAERAAQGVFRRAPKVLVVKSPPCGNCGRCLRCRRDARVLAIQARGRAGDVVAKALAWDLAGAMLAEQGRKDYRAGNGVVYPFSRLRKPQRIQAFLAHVENVCDRSVKLLGAWRP